MAVILLVILLLFLVGLMPKLSSLCFTLNKSKGADLSSAPGKGAAEE
jgi:hypothetical protein